VVRELSNIKDIEADKVREVERRKDAELKMMERLVEGIKKDKHDLEERLEELVLRQEVLESKYAEQHHNTVKYFEQIVA
jgi:hypothetical protein